MFTANEDFIFSMGPEEEVGLGVDAGYISALEPTQFSTTFAGMLKSPTDQFDTSDLSDTFHTQVLKLKNTTDDTNLASESIWGTINFDGSGNWSANLEQWNSDGTYSSFKTANSYTRSSTGDSFFVRLGGPDAKLNLALDTDVFFAHRGGTVSGDIIKGFWAGVEKSSDTFTTSDLSGLYSYQRMYFDDFGDSFGKREQGASWGGVYFDGSGTAVVKDQVWKQETEDSSAEYKNRKDTPVKFSYRVSESGETFVVVPNDTSFPNTILLPSKDLSTLLFNDSGKHKSKDFVITSIGTMMKTSVKSETTVLVGNKDNDKSFNFFDTNTIKSTLKVDTAPSDTRSIKAGFLGPEHSFNSDAKDEMSSALVDKNYDTTFNSAIELTPKESLDTSGLSVSITMNNLNPSNFDTFTATVYKPGEGWVDVEKEGGQILDKTIGSDTVELTFRPPHFSTFAGVGAPGAGGGNGSSSSGGDSGGGCIIERSGASIGLESDLRSLRDWMMDTTLGRWMTQTYYDSQ
jgi:hypothetical protein